MEDKKPIYHKKTKQNRKPHARCVNKPTSAKDVRINLRRAKFRTKGRKNSSNSEESEPEQHKIAPQPKQSWLPYDDILDVGEEGKDFESLVNMPISAEGHFNFNSEKDWSFVNLPQSSEYFSLDLRYLNAAVNCIPFNKQIGLDDTYFTKDQLTYMQSKAEAARKDYEKLSKDWNISKNKISGEITRLESDESTIQKSDNSLNTKLVRNSEKEDKQNSKKEDENFEEDLDFLLTLKEPLMPTSTVPQVSSTSKTKEAKCKSATLPTKSIDLEKWLDSVLDLAEF